MRSFFQRIIHCITCSSAPQMAGTTKIAVVTGGNKGIGFEICKQLASQGNITVVLAARDEKRGPEAVEKLKSLGYGDNVVFHKLDVADSGSVAAFAEFIKSKFGKLDILVNNAGYAGATVDHKAMMAAATAEDPSKVNWDAIIVETYDTAKSGFDINYRGIKRTTEAFYPLLKLSKSPRIVNVTSSMALLKNITHEWAKGILSDIDNLSTGKLEEVVNEYLKDKKDGTTREKGWPMMSGAYVISKALVIAYTRLAAKQYPGCKINAVCPGNIKTDMNVFGSQTAEEGASHAVRVALLPDDCPTGAFFVQKEVSEF